MAIQEGDPISGLSKQRSPKDGAGHVDAQIAKPVFDAIVRNLLRLLGTRYAVVILLKDGVMQLAALDGEAGFEKLADNFPLPLDDTTITGRAIFAKGIIQFAPMAGNPAAPPASVRLASVFGSI